MRRFSALRTLALGALATALWLAPGLRPPGAPHGTMVPKPADQPKIRREAPTLPPPPADTVFSADQGNSAQALAVALDELYFPRRPPSARLAAIPAQPGLATLLAHAATFPSPGPRLVLYPVNGPRNAATRRILNPGLEVTLASTTTPTPPTRPDLGIVAWERPPYAPDVALARIVGDAAQPLRAAAALAGHPGIASARPLLARQWSRKAIPNDPLFTDQWHLRNTGQQGGVSGTDIRAVPAWDTATGAGVVIGIVDDGLDYAHPDLAPAYDASLGHDWNDDDSDPYPSSGDDETEGDNHGTAVAGLAAARGGNLLGVAGAAPSATLASLRLISAPTDDSEDAEAMAWRNDAILIKNNSWGPSDDYPELHPPGPLWRAAVADAVLNLDTFFVWSAGNGQADGDQGSKDGYASLRHVIPVAAVTNRGVPAYFSEGGPHLVVAAPGDASVGVVTTDRPGNLGYNTSTESFPGDYVTNIDYTKAFAGTSAAAPVVSGVIALLLEARPDLGWRDVKEILLRTSTRLQSGGSDWTTRPAGDPARPIKHHPRLGGGLVNALNALTLARTWTPLAPEATLTTGPIASESAIPDAGAPLVLTPPAFPSPGGPDGPDPLILRVEHVELTLDITHPYRGDLEIKLTSPAGTTSVFTTPTKADFGADYKNDGGTAGYTFSSVRHWGESSIGLGRWRISVRDATRQDAGTLHTATLTLYGTPLAMPAVVTDLAPRALATGSTLVLTAAFSGGNLAYQWMYGDKPIPGAIAPTYRLDNFTARAAGTYACVATNPAGSAATTAIAVTADDTSRVTHVVRVGATTDLAFDAEETPRVWSASRLPAGLALDPATGHLLGRPAKPGSYRMVVTATDARGIVTRTPLTVVVAPLPAGLTGTYTALVVEESPGEGVFDGSLVLTTTSAGVASGRLALRDAAYSFSGRLDGQLGAGATLDLSLGKTGLNLLLELDTSGGLHGTLRQADGPVIRSTLQGRISPWKKSTRPATAYAGRQVVALAHADPDRRLGPSILTFAVGLDGRATWKLTPADGAQTLTGSMLLGDGGEFPLFAPYARGLGAFLGTLSVPPAPATELPAIPFAAWKRRPSASLAQPDGFDAVPLVALPGSGRHTAPAAGTRILGRTAATPGLELFLLATADASEASPLPEAGLTVDAGNRFVVAAPNTPRLALSYDAATGRVTGSFTALYSDPANPAVSFARTARVTALVLPGSLTIQGFYLVPPPTTTSPLLSRAILIRPPLSE